MVPPSKLSKPGGRWTALLLAALLAGFGAQGVKADVWTVNQGTGDNKLNATAEFTVIGDTLQIVLSNLLTDQKSAGQSIRALQFVVNGGASTGAALVSAQGAVGLLSGSGVTNNLGVQNLLTTDSLGGKVWSTTQAAGVVELFTDPGGQGGPNRLITGVPTSGSYNGSIGSHNPHVLDTATYVLSFTGGLSAASVISGVRIGFGTNYDSWTTATPPVQPVPEPSTLAFASVGAFCALAYRRRRRNAA